MKHNLTQYKCHLVQKGSLIKKRNEIYTLESLQGNFIFPKKLFFYILHQENRENIVLLSGMKLATDTKNTCCQLLIGASVAVNARVSCQKRHCA